MALATCSLLQHLPFHTLCFVRPPSARKQIGATKAPLYRRQNDEAKRVRVLSIAPPPPPPASASAAASLLGDKFWSLKVGG